MILAGVANKLVVPLHHQKLYYYCVIDSQLQWSLMPLGIFVKSKLVIFLKEGNVFADNKIFLLSSIIKTQLIITIYFFLFVCQHLTLFHNKHCISWEID